MALVLYDRVQQTGTANTTVSFTLSGSVTGYQSFAVVGNGNTTYYGAVDASGNWEAGIGTYATGGTLTRTTILASSNSGSAVSTFSGSVNVFVTYPAEKSVNQDANGNVNISYTPNVATNIGALNVGDGTYSASSTGQLASFASADATYANVILQNTNNTSSSAYSSYVTAANNYPNQYMEIGSNSTNYNATAAGFVLNSLNSAGANFIESYGSDLVLATWTSNNIHFLQNATSATTDSMTLYADGGASLGGLGDPGIGNIAINNAIVGLTTTTASAGTLVLTSASTQVQLITGTTTQTIQLPQATTLLKGTFYTVANNSTGNVTVKDNSGTTLETLTTGGAAQFLCVANGTSAGTWGVRVFASSNTQWGNSALNYSGTITGATWNGGTIGTGYGGTGLTGFSASNYALYSTSPSVLTAGTLPVAAGGTGATTASSAFNALSPITTAGDLIVGTGVNTAGRLGIGTSGYVLQSNGSTAAWASPPGSSTLNIVDFTATSGQTAFSVTYTVGLVEGVYRNGIKLGTADYTATNGTSIVLNTGAITGDLIEVVYFTAVAVANLGTMATQNASAVAITGGTIDNATIGATTPNTGTFTTITGQTEVLKGTGENLVLQSQALATTPWGTANGATVTNNVTTAPNGTTTASKIQEPATTTNYFPANQNISANIVAPTATYTFSCYAKAAERTQVWLANSVSNYTVYFDLSAGTVISSTGSNYISSAISNAGSGWYRCSVTFVAASTVNPFYSLIGPAVSGNNSYASTLGYGIYVWGVQLEIGSVTNTYIPTTTTAVYGTPTLSFSGVAGLGLQSDGSLYVSPAGTGALQAQATTSSTVGGNARGANAVDWQTARSSAGQVAAGAYSVVSGGTGNTASSSGYTGVVGGLGNLASGQFSFIGGGSSNQTGSGYSYVVGGNSNTANGYYNFIGGGYTNTGTSSSTATTQAAATNGVTSGSTAVTLAASNASIKVGQYISGTGIAGNTYVAAISGTSLTLSQNANATGTPTLSFYTPHGVVVGGGNNQATGSYSFIGGGGDAGTSANRNVASGDWSFVGGGKANLASGFGAVVVGGGYDGGVAGNTASGSGSAIVGGLVNQATGNGAFVGGGYNNIANSSKGAILGGYYGTTRSIDGMQAAAACTVPIAYASGVSQSALLILARQTTDATPTVLCSNPNAAGTTNQVILPNNSAYSFRVTIIAGVTGAGNTSSWILQGAIKRGGTASTTAIVGAVNTTLLAQDSGASTWAVSATADTTNGGLAITVTGQASTTIRWVAKAESVEMTY